MVTDDVPRVVPLSADDGDAILDVDQWAFGFDDEDVEPEPLAATFEWDRAFGVRVDDDGRHLAATNLSHSLDLTVPGGELACAGLAWVGVHPQFRRQGLLQAMINHHLRTVHEHGEPVSALYATEAGIYGRFGTGWPVGTSDSPCRAAPGCAMSRAGRTCSCAWSESIPTGTPTWWRSATRQSGGPGREWCRAALPGCAGSTW